MAQQTVDATDNLDEGRQKINANETELYADLAEHEADTANPHQVNKAQIALGSVDNTADVDKPISTAQATEFDTKADLGFTDDTAASDDYTLTLAADNNQLRKPINVAVAKTLTIPLNSAQAFPVGFFKTFIPRGSGAITIAGTGGVTLTTSSGGNLAPPINVPFAILKTGTNTWDVFNGAPGASYTTWTPTLTGYNGAASFNLCRYNIDGKKFHGYVAFEGTSNTNALTFTLPPGVLAGSTVVQRQHAYIVNSGSATLAGQIVTRVSSNIVDVHRDAAQTAWGTSLLKGCQCSFTIEIL